MSGTMVEDRGRDFVAVWPHVMATKVGVAGAWVAEAMKRAEVLPADASETQYGARFDRREYVEEVGVMTPEMTQRVIEELRAIDAELRGRAKTNCHYCGLPLQGGVCPECDSE